MTRIALLCLLIGPLACTPVKPERPVEPEPGPPGDAPGNFCRAVMPKPASWDGKPLPAPISRLAAIYIYDSPRDAGHVWAASVDNDRVTALVDLHADRLGSLIAVIRNADAVGTVTASAADMSLIRVGPVKPERPPPPLKILPVPPPPPPGDAPFLVSLARHEHQAGTQALADVAKTCK